MLALAVEVSHSPAKPITSRPEDSWLKKRGWPENTKVTEVIGQESNYLKRGIDIAVARREWCGKTGLMSFKSLLSFCNSLYSLMNTPI